MAKNPPLDELTLDYGNGRLHLKKNRRVFGLRRKNRTVSFHSLFDAFSFSPFNAFDLFVSSDVERSVDALRKHSNVQVASHVYFTSDEEIPILPTGYLYVAFDEEAPPDRRLELIREHQLRFVEARGPHQFILRTTRGSLNPLKVAKAMRREKAVVRIEPDLATLSHLHDDPYQHWHLQNPGGVGFKADADARIRAAWEELGSYGTDEPVIAVIDEGFDLGHPVFSTPGKIVAPFDYVDQDRDPSPGSRFDHHGTACASLAAGARWKQDGFSGAAPQSRLMPIRRKRQDLSSFEIERYFHHALHHGAWVVSCSWGYTDPTFPLSTLAMEAIRKCAREGRQGRGAVICFSSGNDGVDISGLHGFANHEDVLAIGAVSSLDEWSSYANFGDPLFLCAPSDGVGGWGVYAAENNRTYTYNFGGTSAACAIVAGVCSLLLSVKPDLPAATLKGILRDTARRPYPEEHRLPSGHSTRYGFGCIDALSALRAVKNLP